MKPKNEQVNDSLNRFLNRFGKPPFDEMESAGERVLLQLKLQGPQFRHRSLSEVTDDSISGTDAHRSTWRLPLLAVAALVFAIATPALLLRSLIWPVRGVDGVHRIEFGETFRSNDKTGSVIALPDGSRVEMRSQSELTLEHADDGARIQLKKGSVIVSAAKQGAGHLYVQTKDVTVSVVGTVFLVNAEEVGSRVAVIEGEVHVQQGATLKKLLPGEQVSTNPFMQTVPVIEEIQWSRNLVSHLALLQQAILVPPVPQSQTPAAVPMFDVVSLKPCPPIGSGGRGGPGGGPGGRGGGGAGLPASSPNRLDLPCGLMGNTLEQLIRQAYVTYANGQRNSQMTNSVAIEEGPTWVRFDRYEIVAKTEGSPTPEMMRGPMLQALLEDRFKLKLHRETRDVPVYAMTVLKSGLKVQPLEEGSCEHLDPNAPLGGRRPMFMTPDKFEEVLQPGQKPGCDLVGITSRGPGDPNQTVYGKAMGLAMFASTLSRGLDRIVIDRTGISGIFNFRLQFARDQTTSKFLPPPIPGLAPPPNLPDAASEPAGPSIFTAIQDQLGLKLDPGIGPADFIVIERVERPSEN